MTKDPMQNVHWRVGSAACAMLLTIGSAVAEVPTYKVTELLVGPKADNALYSVGRAISKSGQAAIEFGYTTATGFAAARCTKAQCSLIPELNLLSSPATTPWGMNDVGAIAGSSNAGPNTHAFVNDGVSTQDLGGFTEDGCGGCTLDSHGRGINNAGQVTGRASTVSGEMHAFLYQGPVMQDLGTLGGEFSEGLALNDTGDVVGMAHLPGGGQRAFLYRTGVMSDLGTLGGNQSIALAINDSRQIAGCSTLPGETVRQAFRYQQGTMLALPTLGGNDACALGINRSGWVVGYSTLGSDPTARAFVHDGTQLVDLNNRLDPKTGRQWVMLEARAINDKGQIVGTGLHKGVTRAFLLTPMPVHVILRCLSPVAAGLRDPGFVGPARPGCEQEPGQGQGQRTDL
jgi:probable HAF family extracellular repeat protein